MYTHFIENRPCIKAGVPIKADYWWSSADYETAREKVIVILVKVMYVLVLYVGWQMLLKTSLKNQALTQEVSSVRDADELELAHVPDSRRERNKRRNQRGFAGGSERAGSSEKRRIRGDHFSGIGGWTSCACRPRTVFPFHRWAKGCFSFQHYKEETSVMSSRHTKANTKIQWAI